MSNDQSDNLNIRLKKKTNKITFTKKSSKDHYIDLNDYAQELNYINGEISNKENIKDKGNK